MDGDNSHIKFDLKVIKKNGEESILTDQEAKYLRILLEAHPDTEGGFAFED